MKKMIIKNMMAAASVALVMGGSLTACVDLDLSPNNAPSEGNVWNSASMAEQTIAGVYNRLYEDYTADPNKGWFDMWSSIMDIDANWTAGYHFLHANNTPTSDFGSERWWKNYYSGILRANDVITNLPTVAGISEAKKSRYISECKFLRSWWYYRLNILYGGVPYYTEPVKSIDGAKKARSTQDEIWDYLIQDLTSCIDDPNLPNKYGADSEDYGHVTKGAAYALRGKVYMWKKEWRKAADDFEEVSKCGYKLYTNGSDAYKQLFKAANERCDEMIFSLQCINEEGFGGIKNRGYGNRCLPPDNEGKGLGWNNYVINPQFVDSYENKDGSPFNWDDIIPGYSAMSTNARQVYFLRNEINATERANAEASGADMTQYKNSGNEERIKAAYANRDPRLGFSVITPYSTFIGGIEGEALPYVMRFPYRSRGRGTQDIETDTNSKMYYLNRKFVGEGTETMTYYSEIDLPFIRYADVLLNWAEALNELNDIGGAVSKVNDVRNRAGVAPLNSNADTTVNGKEDMHRRIMNERHWELVGEDVIYFDEIRWGTWKDLKFYTDKEGRMNGMRQVWGSPTYSYTWGGNNYWTLPIPAREIQMNPNMEQNEGWK